MSTTLRWVGPEDYDRVAQTRLLCYAHAGKELEKYKDGIRTDRRAQSGDFLLAERDGEPVGTSTSLSMTMWVRGAPVSCQGVAYVGTIKTHRRIGAGTQRGIASQLMLETLDMARKRQQVVSALMPFRASFYEHFGYGLVERRAEWTLPLALMPSAPFEGIRFARPEDLAALVQCKQRMTQQGQCDIERTADAWEGYRRRAAEGFEVVDADPDGRIDAYARLEYFPSGDKSFLRVADLVWTSPVALVRLLGFLGSLKDQYSAAVLMLPADVPINRLLKESQIPHRPVEHPVPQLRTQARMQVRILDHKRFLEAMAGPRTLSGKIVVEVKECEGTQTCFQIEVDQGRVSVTPSTTAPDLACDDKTWAAIACGELPARSAVQWGLAQANEPSRLSIVQDLVQGPLPFCAEAF